MIHYHGTPCGGISQDLPRFYQGRHALVSFANAADIGVVSECCQTFCLDNGAFSFWKSKTSVDWDKYIDWVKVWCKHPSFDWWLIPDEIDGTEDDNWHLMFKYGRMAPYAVPVYHLHESMDHLNRIVESYPRIAIGSSGQWPTPGTSSWWERMTEVMKICCDKNGIPKTKLHGLRMLDPDIFSKIPLSSADSTNAVLNARSNTRFGMYKPPTAAQSACVIADRIEWHSSTAIWEAPKQRSLWE